MLPHTSIFKCINADICCFIKGILYSLYSIYKSIKSRKIGISTNKVHRIRSLNTLCMCEYALVVGHDEIGRDYMVVAMVVAK